VHGLRLHDVRGEAAVVVEHLGAHDDHGRPTRRGRPVAVTVPPRTGRRNTVEESSVLVVAPAGTLRKAHTAPTLSASVISAPPCSTPPTVQRSSLHVSRPITSPGSARSIRTPHARANGIAASSGSVAGSITAALRSVV